MAPSDLRNTPGDHPTCQNMVKIGLRVWTFRILVTRSWS